MSTKTKNKKHIWEESVEAKPHNTIEPTTFKGELKNLASGLGDNLWKDLLVGSAKTTPELLFGGGEDLQEGQAVSLSKKHDQAPAQQNEEKPQVSMEHMNYFRSTVENADGTGETHMEMQIKRSVDEIRMEIKRLIATSKVVEMTVKDATADKAPIKPGKYHLNFFEFVLSVIRDATRKLEDGAAYGSLFQSKKQQSKYWSSYKTHGTSFGLSGERTTATQTG